MSSDLATTEQSAQPPIRSVGAPTRTPRVQGKLKRACNLIVREGKALDEAAKAVGLTTRTLRLAFERPHVLTYLKAQKQVFREYISSQNIQRLAEIRDNSGNSMAKLGAIKLIEQVDDNHAGGSTASRMPGVLIVIGDKAIQAAALSTHQRMIDANPLISQHSGSQSVP